MKNRNKKILIGSLATLLILGGTSAFIGVASDGFKNWDTSTWFQDEFKDVKIENKTVAHDGTKKELDIIVPEGFTYTTVIKKDDVIVTECIDIGIYDYEVTVQNGDKTKVYKAQLQIVENSEVSINAISNIKKLKVNETTYKLTATISPSSATNKELDWTIRWKNQSSSWANGKNVTDYVQMTVNKNEVTLNLVNRFSEQIIVTATAKDYSKLSASATIDCKIRVASQNAKVETGQQEETRYISGGSPEWGEGIIIDLGMLTNEYVMSSKPKSYDLLDYINTEISYTEGTIENTDFNNRTCKIIESNVVTTLDNLDGITSKFFTFEVGSPSFQVNGFTIEDEPDILDAIDTELEEIGESSYTASLDKAIEYKCGDLTKVFRIYVTNTNHQVRDVSLSDSAIVFE